MFDKVRASKYVWVDICSILVGPHWKKDPKATSSTIRPKVTWVYLCSQQDMYLSEFKNIFVQIAKCIFPHCKVYLSHLKSGSEGNNTRKGDLGFTQAQKMPTKIKYSSSRPDSHLYTGYRIQGTVYRVQPARLTSGSRHKKLSSKVKATMWSTVFTGIHTKNAHQPTWAK